MKRYNNIWKIFCGVVFVYMLSACKTPAGTATSSARIMKTEEAFFMSVIDNTFRFNTLSARMKLDFSSDQQEFSSRAHLKIIHNNCLQLSIQLILGIELFRIEVTTDSVKILDRMNKRFMADSYNNLKGEAEIDFNFQNLQALFTNQMFVPGESDISTKNYRNFRMTMHDNSAELKLKDKNGIFYTFMAGANEKLLSTNIENVSNNQTITWKYQDFNTVNKQQFPLKMTAQLSDGDRTQGTMTFTFSSPEVDSPLKTDFNIPSGFARVTLEQLLISLQKR